MVKMISEETVCLIRYVHNLYNIENSGSYSIYIHFKCLCINNPKKFNSSAYSTTILSIFTYFIFIGFRGMGNTIIFFYVA